MSENNYDVLVVGNGVLGLSLGLTLARGGTRVAVIGKPNRPWAASTAAGAMLGAFGEVTTTLLKSAEGRAKLDIGVRATKMWDPWLAALAEDSGETQDLLTARGTVVLLNSVGVAGIDSANFTAIRQTLDEYGERYEDVDPHDMPWYEPNPTTRALLGMFLPGEHAVDATALLTRLEAALGRVGGTLVPGFGERLVQTGGRITGVALDSGEILSAAQVVLAGGAGTQSLLDGIPDISAGIPPVCAGVGASVVARVDETKPAPTSVLRTPNRAFACGLHLVPRGHGHVYVGATNTISAEMADLPSVRDVTHLLQGAVRQLRTDLVFAGIDRVQVGNRPVTFDGFPLIGPVGDTGLWMMTGAYRDGLHQSPLLADEVARSLVGEEAGHDLSLFAPVRKPIQPQSREEIVETAVLHLLATSHEEERNIPETWSAVMGMQLRADYAGFAAGLDDEYTPPAEILSAARMNPVIAKQLGEYYAATRVTA